MKLELQRYAVIMKTEKSCIKFNNGNLYSLQGYITLHKITKFYTERLKFFSQPKLKISHHRHI
jgi:hypothetical protein